MGLSCSSMVGLLRMQNEQFVIIQKKILRLGSEASVINILLLQPDKLLHAWSHALLSFKYTSHQVSISLINLCNRTLYQTPIQENSCLKLPQMSKNIGVEKMINNSIYIRILTTRCHQVRVNFGILTTVYIFQSVLFHSQRCKYKVSGTKDVVLFLKQLR